MARPTRFQRIQTSDTELNLLQNRIAETFDSITSNPLLGGNFLSQVPLVAGSNLVSHGLGRNYVSWLSGNASAPVSLSSGKSPDPKTFLNLIADAPCSVDVVAY
jgi:hypothetical protein